MMYEIKTNRRNVNGYDVNTWERRIDNFNILEVEVGTIGFCGGDSGHGGRTYFRLKDLSSTDFKVTINNGKYVIHDLNTEVVFEFGGDSELDTFIEALKFAVQVLENEKESGHGYK